MVTALVTGTSRGLGKEVARQLAKRGIEVNATSREPNAPYPLDVRDPDSIERLASRLKSLDVLVNNAGIAMDGFDAEVARNTIDVNLRGPMRLTDRLIPLFSKGARIVNVSSGMGDLSILSAALRKRVMDADRNALVALADEFVSSVKEGTHTKKGWPSSAYGVSKALLNAYTRVLAREQKTLIVNSVCPGWVRTDMGGRGAPRSVEEGASGIVWAATEATTSGGIFRDGQPIDF